MISYNVKIIKHCSIYIVKRVQTRRTKYVHASLKKIITNRMHEIFVDVFLRKINNLETHI